MDILSEALGKDVVLSVYHMIPQKTSAKKLSRGRTGNTVQVSSSPEQRSFSHRTQSDEANLTSQTALASLLKITDF